MGISSEFLSNVDTFLGICATSTPTHAQPTIGDVMQIVRSAAQKTCIEVIDPIRVPDDPRYCHPSIWAMVENDCHCFDIEDAWNDPQCLSRRIGDMTTFELILRQGRLIGSLHTTVLSVGNGGLEWYVGMFSWRNHPDLTVMCTYNSGEKPGDHAWPYEVDTHSMGLFPWLMKMPIDCTDIVLRS